ncbi:MAG: hypothetical protein K8R21_08065 [Leptospira sp.]|nr:hypothetical protein [Leptospira sp.]
MEETLYEEKKTPAGFLIKVRLGKMNYVVFGPSGPEIPKGSKNNSIVVNVPKVVFLGSDFDLSHFHLGELSFVNVKAGKLVIPYQHGGSHDIKTIFLGSGSESDILPVLIYHFMNIKEFMKASEAGGEFNHLVIDEVFSRPDMVNLKIRYHSLNILILKKKITATTQVQNIPESEGDRQVVDSGKVRATDIISTGSNLNMYSGNPVFLARIHLRNMELDKVKQILFDFNLSSEDVKFIKAFLAVMIKNENNKEELEANKEKLKNLDEIFRLSLLIQNKEEVQFEKELEAGFSREAANMINTLLEKYQDEAKNVEDEIMYWEWKYRTRRILT